MKIQLRRSVPVLVGLCLAFLLSCLSISAQGLEEDEESRVDPRSVHHEVESDPYLPLPAEMRRTQPARAWVRGGRTSVQVNVDGMGNDILNDAANEPSLAVDFANPNRIAIGWRQFGNIGSSFREAGVSYSSDGGVTWTAGVIDGGNFRSDPVLEVDSAGNFYYYSLTGSLLCDTFISSDGGASWGTALASFGGDKAWIAMDRTGGIGDGNLYSAWSPAGGCCGPDLFTRSADGAQSFDTPVGIPNQPFWGVTTVGPSGEVYVVGRSTSLGGFALVKSTTISDPANPLTFQSTTSLDLGGPLRNGTGPNPGGLLGQAWVATAPSGNDVYVLASVNPAGLDPLDVHVIRSQDGGQTFGAPIRVNDDPLDNGAWQWFGTLSVAPNGRLDAVWADSRNFPGALTSELFYSFSLDGGLTWSANEVVSPSFDPLLGHPQQNKIGDYYDMVSDLGGAHLTYSATFTGGQDVYYLRIASGQFFFDGFESGDLSGWSQQEP